MPDRARVIAILLFAALLLPACESSDAGRCCTRLDQSVPFPVPDMPMGTIPRDVVKTNLKFDCESAVCASVEGSEPVCVTECSDDKPCDEGFECVDILESDPGENSTLHGKKFCARKRCGGDADCPDGSKCELVHAGTDPIQDPEIRQCVREEHKCSVVKPQ
jgi:hypothetical protein